MSVFQKFFVTTESYSSVFWLILLFYFIGREFLGKIMSKSSCLCLESYLFFLLYNFTLIFAERIKEQQN